MLHNSPLCGAAELGSFWPVHHAGCAGHARAPMSAMQAPGTQIKPRGKQEKVPKIGSLVVWDGRDGGKPSLLSCHSECAGLGTQQSMDGEWYADRRGCSTSGISFPTSA